MTDDKGVRRVFRPREQSRKGSEAKKTNNTVLPGDCQELGLEGSGGHVAMRPERKKDFHCSRSGSHRKVLKIL